MLSAESKARAGDRKASSYRLPDSTRPSGNLLFLICPIRILISARPGEVVGKSSNLKLVNPSRGHGTEPSQLLGGAGPFTLARCAVRLIL